MLRLTSHLWGLQVKPRTLCGKVGSCLPMLCSLQYRTLTNYMYWFPLPIKIPAMIWPIQCWFVYLGFYVAFNTVQVISRRVVGRAEETSTYSSLGFCTVNCWPTASNYQLSHLRPWRGSNPGCRGGRRECYHSATVAPYTVLKATLKPKWNK